MYENIKEKVKEGRAVSDGELLIIIYEKLEEISKNIKDISSKKK